jgi:hypothetical protein
MSEQIVPPSDGGRRDAKQMRYTLTMEPEHWLQWLLAGISRRVLTGTGSSIQGNELLIRGEAGTFHSINYARVRYMTVEVIEWETHSAL